MAINNALFHKELKDAGISGDEISVGSDGEIAFREDVPQSTRDSIAAILAAHDPAKPAPPPEPTVEQERIEDLVILVADDAATPEQKADAKARLLAAKG